VNLRILNLFLLRGFQNSLAIAAFIEVAQNLRAGISNLDIQSGYPKVGEAGSVNR
jgi:hypothetical protein